MRATLLPCWRRRSHALPGGENALRPNTAYLKRLDLYVGRSCAYLHRHRRTPSPMRKPQRLADVLDLLRCYYSFVRPHGSLRFGSVTRTPAMQAERTPRALTLREVFSWVPRPTASRLDLTWSM